MDESSYGDKPSSSLFSRYRSPSFRKEEVKILVELVEKHKNAVLNKSTNATANYTKEIAWAKIAKEFNRRGLGLERSMDVLKTKWDNLKRSARKLSKDVMDDEMQLYHDEIIKAVALICAAENGHSDIDEKLGDNFDEKEDFKPWVCDDGSASINSNNGGENQNRAKRYEMSAGFSPRECRVLLQCVRQEKNVLFSKTSVIKRHQAWKRIANSYNKQSPRKRTAKELNKKFTNMKAMAKKIHIKDYFKDIKRKKYEPLSDDVDQKIKTEPIMGCVSDFDIDSDDEKVLRKPIDVDLTNNSHLGFNNDPLANIHNSDSGLGSISDSKDVARLKLELLNYKMETARLQRKQIEESIKADEKERKIRALEHSMRLRAARLEVIAAEAKLSPSHSALRYTEEERIAQQYICNTHLDIG